MKVPLVSGHSQADCIDPDDPIRDVFNLHADHDAHASSCLGIDDILQVVSCLSDLKAFARQPLPLPALSVRRKCPSGAVLLIAEIQMVSEGALVVFVSNSRKSSIC